MRFALSKKSQKCVVAICRKIMEANDPDSDWYLMASGIMDYVQKNGALSDRQANWVCKNADYHDLERPEELRDFEAMSVSKTKSESQTKSIKQMEIERLSELLDRVKELEETIVGQIRNLKGH